MIITLMSHTCNNIENITESFDESPSSFIELCEYTLGIITKDLAESVISNDDFNFHEIDYNCTRYYDTIRTRIKNVTLSELQKRSLYSYIMINLSNYIVYNEIICYHDVDDIDDVDENYSDDCDIIEFNPNHVSNYRFIFQSLLRLFDETFFENKLVRIIRETCIKNKMKLVCINNNADYDIFLPMARPELKITC